MESSKSDSERSAWMIMRASVFTLHHVGESIMLSQRFAHLRDLVLRFGFSLLMVALATYVRVLLDPSIHDRLPFGTYTVAVIAVAWVAGVWPAVFALLSSTLCAAHFIIPPEQSLSIAAPADLFSLLVFTTVGTISIGLFSRIEFQRRQTMDQSTKIMQLNAELTQRDRQKDEFLALLAHELRSPLAPIGNTIALLRRERQLKDSASNLVNLLHTNYCHLVRLVNDLLDVSRYIRGTIELKRERTNLVECVQLAIDMNRDELDRKRHDLHIDLPNNPLFVNVDPVRLCQIVSNLLSNAIRYTPDKGRIAISSGPYEEGVFVQVSDNGLGIPEAIRELVFTPFFQAHPKQSRYAPGLGLGLSIVKKLVELHGGHVEVFSRGANNGTRFLVTLPCASAASIPESDSTDISHSPEANCHVSSDTADAMTRPALQVAVQHTNAQQADLLPATRVLIVDDDTDTANTLRQLLELEGLAVEVAHDGHSAVRRATSFIPHFILLDIGLPEMDGYEVAGQLRKKDALPRSTIIAVSGWGSESDKAKGRAAGFDAHLVKPVRPDELLRLMEAHRNRPRSEISSKNANDILQQPSAAM